MTGAASSSSAAPSLVLPPLPPSCTRYLHEPIHTMGGLEIPPEKEVLFKDFFTKMAERYAGGNTKVLAERVGASPSDSNCRQVRLFFQKVIENTPPQIPEDDRKKLISFFNESFLNSALRTETLEKWEEVGSVHLIDNPKLYQLSGTALLGEFEKWLEGRTDVDGAAVLANISRIRTREYWVDEGLKPDRLILWEILAGENYFNEHPDIRDLPGTELKSAFQDWIQEHRERLERIRHAAFSEYGFKTIPPEICNLTSLRSLDLSRNQISHLPGELFEELRELNSLNLSDNQIKTIPESISTSSLSRLCLGNNQIEALPFALFEIETLSSLDLDNNQIRELPTGDIPEHHEPMWINLSENRLTHIPPLLLQLPATHVYLRSNQITEIPRLTGMDYPSLIDLSHNQITVLPRELIDHAMPSHDVGRADDYKMRLDISDNPLRRVEVDVSDYFHASCLINIDEDILPLFPKHTNFPPTIQTMDLYF